jgi:hypothetical protein
MKVFIEAQGKFAPSVQYPEMELRKYGVQPRFQSEYLDSANLFLTQRLNSSYQEMEADSIYKFDAALYWRFLYEQYSSVSVVRTALVEMTKQYSPDIVPAIKTVMDHTFAQHAGPFETFEDSLVAFARANYALRLHEGHCIEDDLTMCNGNYYDPSRLYTTPLLEVELAYNGTSLTYEGAIPSSFGMDFIEIHLDACHTDDQITITVEGNSEITMFNVQVWPIVKSIPHNYLMTSDPIAMTQQEGGVQSSIFDKGDNSEDMILALIITRLDAVESGDPNGKYTVSVIPDSG